MSDLSATLSDLRIAFDRGFQEPIAMGSEAGHLILAIRVERDAFALRVDELAAVSRAPKIVPIPSRASALIGLSGIDGRLVGVYSLAVLLGHPRESRQEIRWIAQCRNQASIGIAFSEIEGNLLMAPSELRPGPAAPQFAVAAIGSGSEVRWLLGLAEMVNFIGSVRKGD